MPVPLSVLHRLLFSTASATPEFYTLSLHDALPILFATFLWIAPSSALRDVVPGNALQSYMIPMFGQRSEEHTSELQSRGHLVCRLLLEKKNDEVKHKTMVPMTMRKQKWNRGIQSSS